MVPFLIVLKSGYSSKVQSYNFWIGIAWFAWLLVIVSFATIRYWKVKRILDAIIRTNGDNPVMESADLGEIA